MSSYDSRDSVSLCVAQIEEDRSLFYHSVKNSKFQSLPCKMASSNILQELLASSSNLTLFAIASLIISIVIISIRRLSKSADDSILLYTPQTVALGNYKKRWTYDNPNALREAYSKVVLSIH
jgi:hypothetical protein